MIRGPLHPIARAASTNSTSRMVRKEPRTRRVVPIHPIPAMIRMSSSGDGFAITEMTMISGSDGIDRNTSVRRIRPLSTTPP